MNSQDGPVYRIFLVEDHPAMRRAMSRMMATAPDFLLCGQANSAEEALPLIRQTSPHLVVIDITLPGMNGLDLVRTLHQERPALLCLILSGHPESVYAQAAFEAGAQGYLVKDAAANVLTVIRTLLNGDRYFGETGRG